MPAPTAPPWPPVATASTPPTRHAPRLVGVLVGVSLAVLVVLVWRPLRPDVASPVGMIAPQRFAVTVTAQQPSWSTPIRVERPAAAHLTITRAGESVLVEIIDTRGQVLVSSSDATSIDLTMPAGTSQLRVFLRGPTASRLAISVTSGR